MLPPAAIDLLHNVAVHGATTNDVDFIKPRSPRFRCSMLPQMAVRRSTDSQNTAGNDALRLCTEQKIPPGGFEPPTFGFGSRRSIQLIYGGELNVYQNTVFVPQGTVPEERHSKFARIHAGEQLS